MSAAIRAGYKQTEVGVIPGDWEVDRLDRFWSVTDCKHVTAQFIPNGYPLASIKEVQSRFVNLTDAKQTTQSFFNLLIEGGRKPQVGDLIISRNATVGEVAQVADWHPLFAMGQDVCLIRKRQKEFSTDYLQSVFRSNIVASQLSDSMVGSTFKRINVQQIKSFKVPMPGFPEQRAIAAALSDVDALLAKLDELIAKKRDLKQAAMQQLLTGQTRLPGFGGEWEVRPLASVVANLEAGVSVNSVEHGKPLSSGEPCILKTSAIFDGRFDPEECKLIDRRDISRAKLSPRRDTIIISRMNTPNLVGEVGYVPADFPTLNLPDRLWMTRFDTGADICARWLAYVMSSAQVKENIKGLATGTSGSMKNIGKSVLLALQLNFPTGQEQTAIATILSDMDTELAALEARRDKTRGLKQGMMQELLTGRIRLV